MCITNHALFCRVLYNASVKFKTDFIYSFNYHLPFFHYYVNIHTVDTLIVLEAELIAYIHVVFYLYINIVEINLKII